ncbi:hypothetical protein KCP77_17055 [Salmonella enterica subsp. enterica]|nr:hypothetical protein KCP77_17055 [Salmonella enterica subsp. enterica]
MSGDKIISMLSPEQYGAECDCACYPAFSTGCAAWQISARAKAVFAY